MNYYYLLFLFLLYTLPSPAKNYFVAVDGNDSNPGTQASPFATLRKAQSVVQAGDTVYIRGGNYKITEEQIMVLSDDLYARVFNMNKSGTDEHHRICYWGYPNERPVFDLSEVKPADKRVSVFYVTGSYLHFKNFEIIGTQVTLTGHTQSECLSNRGGSHNIYENLSMHDGMAIGFYLVKGSHNLVLNCDAYNNYDPVSEGGRGGNVDGFGGHPTAANNEGNVFRGCRAWYNSDDGFDLINAHSAYTIDHCWAFYNGYKPGTLTSAGDGTGFKAGGYGMSDNPKVPAVIPRHTVQFCIAYYNKNKGFYANHHLGGINWYHNTGYKNPSNYCMLNRKSAAETVDVPGYGHTIQNNLSYSPRTAGKHIIDVNAELCEITNNSFLPQTMDVSASDFISLDEEQLKRPRQADGSLPEIDFLSLKTTTSLFLAGIGHSATGNQPTVDYNWLLEAAIVVEGTLAKVVGPGAEKFDHFYINGNEVNFSTGQADLSSYSGLIELKATSSEGGISKLKINR